MLIEGACRDTETIARVSHETIPSSLKSPSALD